MTYSIHYPRRVLRRSVLRSLTRLALKLLTRTTVTGRDNLPVKGPLILVGNHVGMMEVILMLAHVPYLAEGIGTGDVPPMPPFHHLVRFYGYIPIQRGTMDRSGMNKALDVLKQDGVIFIFPEGGIWQSGLKQARSGVAWLSYQSGAPLVPVGFGGMQRALPRTAQLKRPHMTMNIGEPMPPVELNGRGRKLALAESADLIMGHVVDLIPQSEKDSWPVVIDEQFDLHLRVVDAAGQPVTVPDERRVQEPVALAKLFHRPIILQTLNYNLRLPVNALCKLETDPVRLAQAADVVLAYLTDTNPFFLTYRFGPDEGKAMQAGMVQLRDLALWAADQGYRVEIDAERRYHNGVEPVVEHLR